MLGVLPFVEDPDLLVSAARATSATLAVPSIGDTAISLEETAQKLKFQQWRYKEESNKLHVSCLAFILLSSIPDICHGRHGRRPCKFFLPGVNFQD